MTEIKQALRVLRRTPGFTMVTVTMLTLGIAATTAMFSVLDAVVLRPLPYPDPQALVAVMHPTTVPGSGEARWGLSAAGYFQFKRDATSFVDLGSFRTGVYSIAGDAAGAEEVRVAQVTASVLSTLRAKPHLGRLIGDDDDRPGAPSVIVLSHGFWMRRFAGDTSVVGRTIETSNGNKLVIGVAEPGLTLPKPGPFASTANLAGFAIDIWQPLQLDPAAPAQNSHQYSGIARLKPGVTTEQAQNELSTIVARFTQLFPQAYSENFMKQYHFRVGVTPLHDEIVGPTIARTLWVLLGAVGLVLVIACANVANLFIVRYEARRRDAAIRAALGADRRRLIRQSMTESLLLTVTAGIASVVIAYWAVPGLVAVAPRNIPLLGSARLHPNAAVFSAIISIVAGVVLGMIPLMRSTGDVQTLRDGGRGNTASRRQRLLRSGLVVSQVALAVVLLAGAGLLLRSAEALRRVDTGVRGNGVLTFRTALPFDKFQTLEAGLAFHRELSERIGALPGVTHVGAVTALPLRDYGAGCSVVFREKQRFGPGEQTPCVSTQRATPGFFEALSIEVRGRAPTWSDVDDRTQATVVTRALAERLWPDQDPIGKGINSNGEDTTLPSYRVVGVIPELRAAGMDQPPTEAVFYAATSNAPSSRSTSLNGLTYVVKTTLASPLSLLPAIRQAVAQINARVPVVDPIEMQEVVDRSMARTSFIMLLLTLAAGMALLLSAVGIYGVISYVVAQQQVEIGIRLALGAQATAVAAGIIKYSLTLTAIGIAAGVTLAIGVTRVLQSLLFGVDPLDPLVIGAAIAALVAVGVIASALPALRAAKIDPLEALRT